MIGHDDPRREKATYRLNDIPNNPDSMTVGGVRYNPNRDIAYIMIPVLARLFKRLEWKDWPELEEVLAVFDLSAQDYGDAVEALAKYLQAQQANLKTPFIEILDDAGWFQCKPAAQVAVMSTLGIFILGLNYKGVREATINGDGPGASLQELGDQAIAEAKMLAQPRWKRWLRRKAYSIRRALRALRGEP